MSNQICCSECATHGDDAPAFMILAVPSTSLVVGFCDSDCLVTWLGKQGWGVQAWDAAGAACTERWREEMRELTEE